MAVMAFSTMFAMASTPAAAAPTDQAATPAATQDNQSAFTPTKCQFTIGADATPKQTEGKTYKCGMVTVPEDHSKPDGKKIQIAVAVFKSTAKKPEADPVIYLDGGPGGYTLVQAPDYLGLFQSFLDKRDLILFDQRGTGFSTPSLYCSENTKLDHDLISVILSPAEGSKRQTDATLACQKRLTASGINLAAYNTDQDGADVNSIREALGYKTLNLYGISYGTRLALNIMRDFPTTVRSSIIDSVVPVEAPMEVGQIPATQRVFKQLWDGCKADPGCDQAYPNLEKVFYATVDKLNKKPVTVTTTDPNDNKSYKVAIDGNALQNFLFNTFYVTSIIPQLPEIIYGASKGKLDTIAYISLIFIDEDKTLSIGMYFSVNCRERLAFETMDQVTKAATGNPQQILDNELPSLQSEFDICKAWGAGTAPKVDTLPVKSDIPTLVMAATYDPVTPAYYAKQVADNLSNSYFFEIPNSGHGASLSGDCPFAIVTSFVDDPSTKPDGSCVDNIGAPQWKTPAS
jgi:pimeloyl-ACP methyl ester carboxylesterase